MLSLAIVCLWPRSARRSEGPVRPGTVTAPSGVDALRARVEVLETEVRMLASRCERVGNAQPVVVPTSASPQAAPQPQSTLDDPEDEDQRRSEQLAEQFEALVRTERVDRSHGERLTRELVSQLAKHSPDTRVSSVECTTSSCKLVMEHLTRGAQRAIDESLEAWEARKAGIAYDYDDSVDPPMTIAYLSRVREPAKQQR